MENYLRRFGQCLSQQPEDFVFGGEQVGGHVMECVLLIYFFSDSEEGISLVETPAKTLVFDYKVLSSLYAFTWWGFLL